jgi:exopolyphosphatase/guanosine-5'-triphosphate,3'-diphosphate pyrophosphatase
MKIAALDLGSNTFLLLVAEVVGGRIVAEHSDHVETVRIGQGVARGGRLLPEALVRAEACLSRFARVARESGVERTMAVATSAARDAENGSELVNLGARYGIQIQVIDGNREADLTFLGATWDRADRDGLAVVDVGGGSTEILLQASGRRLLRHSLNIGGVRLTEMHVTSHPIPPVEMSALVEHCERAAQGLEPVTFTPKEVIAVAGTPVTLAKLIRGLGRHEDLVEGERVDVEHLERWTRKLAALSVNERLALPGMDPGRADVMVASCLCLRTALRHLGANAFSISKRGVRHGVALWAAGTS